MYDQCYEEYINSVLGTRNNVVQMPINQMAPQMNSYPEMNNFYMNNLPQLQSQAQLQTQPVEEIEAMYPEIYKLIFPMIVKRCEECNEPINENLLSRMTDEVYSTIEPAEIAEIEKKLGVKTEPQMTRNRGTSVKDPRGIETREFGRRGPLRDLIRILFLRELIDGRFPGHCHGRHCRRDFMPRSVYGPYMY